MNNRDLNQCKTRLNESITLLACLETRLDGVTQLNDSEAHITGLNECVAEALQLFTKAREAIEKAGRIVDSALVERHKTKKRANQS